MLLWTSPMMSASAWVNISEFLTVNLLARTCISCSNRACSSGGGHDDSGWNGEMELNSIY